MTVHLSCKEKEQQITRLACDKSHPSTGVLDIADWANRATLDMIGIAGMGRDFGAIHDSNADLVREYTLQPEHRDILSVALQNGGFSEEGLIDQLMTFLAAGHETTATAVTWVIYLLCVHRDVQTTLRQEIREKLPRQDDHKSSFTHQNIDSMTYLHAICDEVLRYAPHVPFTICEAVVDTMILNQPVPKGTKIMLVPRATNRDAHLWGPDAKEFKPERWLEPDIRSNYAKMTFLHGPRSCIGRSFAKAEFAILLAVLVGRFEFELEDDRLLDERHLKVTRAVTARPVNGFLVKVTSL
ncbi:hypothetical protein AtubIFM57258_008810 [Aspergillus tubingensis]|nr:hypothetical protein AtubIFM57258_008810 [Aspergillus tubingensis]